MRWSSSSLELLECPFRRKKAVFLLRVDLRFRWHSGFHISGERVELWTDKALALDWKDEAFPTIPATTLKGWLREGARAGAARPWGGGLRRLSGRNYLRYLPGVRGVRSSPGEVASFLRGHRPVRHPSEYPYGGFPEPFQEDGL